MTAATFTIPHLDTARLRLRDYRESDFDDFAGFYDSDRSRFVGGPMTRELAWRAMAVHLGHWALRGYGFWAVEEKATGAFCGHVGLWFPEGWAAPEVGWVLMRQAEGRGIAEEAARAARAHAYGTLGWTTAISAIDPGNIRSIRLAQRLGCTYETDYLHVRLGRMQIWRHPPPERTTA